MKPYLLLLLMVLSACTSVQMHSLNSAEEVLVTFTLPETSPNTHSGSQRSYRGGLRWQVDLLTRQRARQFANRYGLTMKEGWPIDALGLYCVAYSLPASLTLAELVNSATNRDDIHGIQANTQFQGMAERIPTYDDPLFKYQFGEHAHRLVDLHRHSIGQSVSVGIIDSSVDTQHADLAGQIKEHTAFAKTSAIEDLRHGTAVAGVIAAAPDNKEGVVGVAPAAEVHVFGACRSSDHGTACDAFNVLKALQAAIDQRVQILNLSLAGRYDPLVNAMIDEAVKRDTIVIAARNTHQAEKNFPASHKSVFAASGDLGLWFTHPEQMTTQAGGGYQVYRGSSISAAGLTGVAALIRARVPQTRTRALLEELQHGCRENQPRLFDHEMCL